MIPANYFVIIYLKDKKKNCKIREKYKRQMIVIPSKLSVNFSIFIIP